MKLLKEQHNFFNSEIQNLIVMLVLTTCEKYSNNEKDKHIQKWIVTLGAQRWQDKVNKRWYH